MSTPVDPDATALRPGEQLQRARERRGLSPAQAAHEMRVDQATLRALESDDYARLGAPIFVKGHLRNYAKFLGLEAAPLLEAYERIAAPQPPSLVGYRNEGEQMGGHVELRRLLPVVAGGIAITLMTLFALWLFRRPATPPPAVELAATPAPASIATPSTLVPAAGPSTGPAAAPATAATAAPGAADPTRTTASAVTANAAPGAAPQGEPAKPAAVTGEVRVTLRFSGESWVEVSNAKGEMLVYEQFSAGRSRELTAAPPLRVFLGQASVVALSVDGKPVDLAPLIKRDATARVTVGANGAIR